MRDFNVISFSDTLFPGNETLSRYLAALWPQLNLWRAHDLQLSHHYTLQGVNLFIFNHLHATQTESRQLIEKLLKQNQHHINICLLDGQIDLPQHIDLFTAFHDFLMWPCTRQEMEARIYRFLPTQPISNPIEKKLLAEFAHLHLTGESAVFIKTVSLIKKIAGCHASVLIQGETGTGKENAARAIHYLSDRRDHAFIPINCAAIPDELIESELFGHEKGAFTDAKTTQIGLVCLAQGGTLFLDEVDSLSPKAQATLLRFLQTQEFRPLGSKTTSHADVRIVAATNADLKELAQKKCFREDLYFRLNVLNLCMPPLRERIGDIPLLAKALIDKFSQQHKIPVKWIHPSSLDYLKQQSWPGNIRELENVLLRSFLLSSGNTLLIDHQENHTAADELPAQGYATAALSFQDAKAQAIIEFEKKYLQHLMSITEGNVSAAARLAGKERRALGKLLQKYRIQKSQFQTEGESA